MEERSVARLAISVNAVAGGTAATAAQNVGQAQLLSDLFDVLDEQRIPATWAVPQPATSPLFQRICCSTVRHGVALWYEPPAVAESHDRTRWAQEITAAEQQMAAVGLRLTTLAFRGAVPASFPDLLVRHKIGLLRGSQCATEQPLRVHSRRFGLWLAQPTSVLPDRPRWFARPTRAAHQDFERGAITGDLVHLVIDGPGLSPLGLRGLKTVERILQFAMQLRGQQRLMITSLEQVVAGLSRLPLTSACRSVLRAA